MMSNDDVPSFAEAVFRMEAFLRDCKRPTRIEWVFFEDITGYKCNLWVRLPVPPTNADLARAMYETGAQHGLGVLVCALCSSDDTSYCYVWFPATESEADDAMIVGLKLSIWHEPLYPVRYVRSRFRWYLHKTINHFRGRPSAYNLPRKKEAHDKLLHQTALRGAGEP